MIVDDEEAILTVLKNSLKKLGPDYYVNTVTNGPSALDMIAQGYYDLVVTDYKMVGMNGLELADSIHALTPQTKIILMTGYGNALLEAQTNRLPVYRYLTKPLEIDIFRQMVKEAMEPTPKEPGVSRMGFFMLSDECYHRVNRLLTQLQIDIGARCVLLTNADGRFVIRVGNADSLPLEQITALTAGSIATLVEAGRAIDGNPDSINLAYRESTRDNLYAMNVDRDLLVVVIIEQSPFSSRLGSVWYYARQTILAIREVINNSEKKVAGPVFGEGVELAVDMELDKLMSAFDPPQNQASEPSRDVLESGLKDPPAGLLANENPRPGLIEFRRCRAGRIAPGRFY